MRALGILAKAPIPGRVKMRLAEDVGPSAAAEVYWEVGRRVVAASAGSGYRTTVWFTPADEGAFVREWLEEAGRVEYRPQTVGTLGARLAAAFQRHFGDGAQRAVIIGTDCPGVDRRLVNEAFTALGGADVVLGPSVDGGYYLIGLREPQPGLFREIPWSSTAVAAQTRARAGALGLAVHLLKPLRDVDTVQDARALGLLKP
ncbi:MAG TPA: TIGR04282 family arsenosugar biosynthesis glycosyltransferase [Gemmatimonadales bacterium]|nr:TIGR04282 family arsenosugar biosynthesis glycosyltransferase [Gemmatimonadales bacterium]